MTRADLDRLGETFRRDGVAYLPGALSAATLAQAQAAWQWSIDNPGPGASELPANGDGTFYQDLANPAALARYTPLVRDTEIADIACNVLGHPSIWFMYEQIFLKENGTTRRTPWHQDTPYLPVEGDDLLVMWITFEPVSAANALEFVRGSHRGLLYDGSSFDPADDTRPLYGTGEMPRLPDIEADRTQWDIAAWDITPGDVLLFHPSILHGGAPTHVGMRRSTLSLRFFGPDARVAQRPGMMQMQLEQGQAPVNPTVHPLTRMRQTKPGAPFRDAAFPMVAAHP